MSGLSRYSTNSERNKRQLCTNWCLGSAALACWGVAIPLVVVAGARRGSGVISGCLFMKESLSLSLSLSRSLSDSFMVLDNNAKSRVMLHVVDVS